MAMSAASERVETGAAQIGLKFEKVTDPGGSV
jgi:hypothetical protein